MTDEVDAKIAQVAMQIALRNQLRVQVDEELRSLDAKMRSLIRERHALTNAPVEAQEKHDG